MKRFLLTAYLLLACVFGLPPQMGHCEQPRPAAATTLSPTEIAQLQQNVALFAKVLGMTDTTTVAATGSKSMADVADKFLEYSKAAVLSTVGAIEKVAPQIWEVMILQQYAKAAKSLIGPVSFFLFFMFFRFWIVHRKPEQGSRDVLIDFGDGDKLTQTGLGKFLNLACLGVMVTSLVFLAASLPDAIAIVVNPRYYALRDLILLLLNRGQGM